MSDLESTRPATLEELIGAAELECDELLIGLGGRFGSGERRATLGWLDEAARGLFEAAALSGRHQAQALADALTNRLALRPDVYDHRALLVDHVRTHRRAHPIVIAAVGHELARRAGLHSRVCTAGHEWVVALGGHGPDLHLVTCTPCARLDGDVRLRVRCAHEIALALLIQIARQGPAGWDRRARALARELPLRHRA